MEKERLEAAARVISAAADEATTIEKYTLDLAALLAVADADAAADIEAQYREIIGDELNDIERFCELYVAICGIRPAED